MPRVQPVAATVPSRFSPYTASFAIAYRGMLAYRFANWAGAFTNIFFLFFRAFLMEACYAAVSSKGGYSQADALTYIAVSQALIMVIPQWGVVGIANSVRSGQIAGELCRPVDYYFNHMCGRLGVAAYYVTARFVPLCIVALLAGLLVLPPDPWLAPVLVVSAFFATWIASSLIFLIEISAFWLDHERGVRRIMYGVCGLFSGLYVPLVFFPDWLRTVSDVLPFQHTLFAVCHLWLGKVAWADVPGLLAVQAGWAVALALCCKFAVAAGARRLVVQGG
jgi:ABC-2 type transport system permease protein